VHTQLPPGTPALYVIGTQQSVPILGAPGNLLLVLTQHSVFRLSDAQGDVTSPVPLSPNLFGFTFHAQFGLLDPAVNQLGITTSEGFAIQIR